MRKKQANPVKHSQKYRFYKLSALMTAYDAVKKEKMSVAGAAKKFNVPEQTLRDRVKGKVEADCVAAGRTRTLSQKEELKLVELLKSVSNHGCYYTRQEVVDIASNYAVHLGKRTVDNQFTFNWLVQFSKRWPELRIIKPRTVAKKSAMNATSVVVSKYFDELGEIVDTYGLKCKPHLIFNVDEKSISHDQSEAFHHSAATEEKTTTIIGCGSASGVAIPPFFVFSGKKMSAGLLEGSTPGAAGAVSLSGSSNFKIFHKYLTEHFVKCIPQREPGQHLLLFLDGDKTHVSVQLEEWANSQNIILFILPANMSHVLQPLDVTCYGPFQNIHDSLCNKEKNNSSSTVKRNIVCHLGCTAYSKALSSDNLQSGFQKTGIYPFNKDIIPAESLSPAKTTSSNGSSNNTEPQEENGDSSNKRTEESNAHKSVKKNSTEKRKKTSSEIGADKADAVNNGNNNSVSSEHQSAKKRKHPENKNDGGQKTRKRKPADEQYSPEAGPSNYNISADDDGTDEDDIDEDDNDEDDNDEDDNEEAETEEDDSESVQDQDKCCVCNLFTPSEVLKNSPVSLTFTTWVQCDKCPHWVHLGYCSKVRVIRRGDEFYCPHCIA